MRELDLKGLKCPLPALKLRRALRRLPAGEALMVLCTDPLAQIDIPNAVRESGDLLLSQGERDGAFVFVVERRAGVTAA
ncbi:sulfurtransferase TusA family protein [Chelatococcus reniformis]|uniref:UPF0033 domain-containing protein n=1 Tax=Chelatococcus reniformis TaxID=1494448 RepID=A0A916XPA2_9HYPH|nr:sulfurtransferase TusA family protein [Chelatococcus reniformis]GGC92235.1 hypothetical protein GCM10010994_57580 [Chelatococcus reniformis]